MQAQFDPDSAAAWQVRIFKKSAPRKAMLDQVQRLLPPTEEKACLDIGGRDGMIPFMLRKRGGSWISSDSRESSVEFMQVILGDEHVVQLDGPRLPFEENCFDLIVVLEHVERIREDGEFLKDCHRCLRPDGCLVIHVPHVKSFSALRGIRSMLGLTSSVLGRVRPGYRLHDLYEISKNGFDIVESRTYGGFLENLIETLMIKCTGDTSPEQPDDLPPPGEVPDQQVLRNYASRYRMHAVLYPVVLLCRGLDRLFRFTCNHSLVVQLKPRPWMERRGVRMRDGRSIADATINTKIGSAADLTDPKNNRS